LNSSFIETDVQDYLIKGYIIEFKLSLSMIYLSDLLFHSGTQQVRSEPNNKGPRDDDGLTSTTNSTLIISSLVRPGGMTNSSSTSTSTMMTVTATGGSDALGDDNPFENNTFSNTTVPLGDTAFLKCSVRNLGERTVSFIIPFIASL